MGPKVKNRRRRLVVNKPVQRRIVVGITLIPVLILIAATLAVAVLTGRVLDEASTAEENLPTLGYLFMALFVFIIAAGGVVVLQAVRYSHKIAGPMYRLVKSIESVREGDLSFRVTLRDGDELTDIADEFNLLMDWIVAHPPAGVELKLTRDTEESEGSQTPPDDDVMSESSDAEAALVSVGAAD
ncbi:MAG: hypothetical protein CMJ85_12510 [Planctomycetes bacterium]|jgi:hypothetical protein|nr:hypothetical protein [Planctomycetota bacterium]